jgi:predicted metal-binding protein
MARRDATAGDRGQVEALLKVHGLDGYKWIDPAEIEVAHWVRMKCRFGCPDYGHNATCPPNTPPVEECRSFFREYGLAAVLHFAVQLDDPEDRHEWTREINEKLLQLERAVFLAGFHKAFMLFLDNCNLCEECAGRREECLKPREARPNPDSMAVDVYGTVRKIGYPIEVLDDYDKRMNRYAILLVR